MRFFLSIMLVLIGINIAHGQDYDSFQLHDLQLKVLQTNSVKSMSVYKFNIHRNGKKIDSTLVKQVIFQYGNGDNIVEHIETFDKKIHSVYNLTCVYDDKHNIIRRSYAVEQPKKDGHGIEYEYDNMGRISYVVDYNGDTSTINTSHRIYDYSGKWVKTLEKFEAKNNRLIFLSREFVLRDSLFYNGDGRLSERRHYGMYEKSNSAFFYEYNDDNGRSVTVTEQMDNTQHIISNNKYNKAGLLLQSMYSPFSNPFLLLPDDQTLTKYYYNPNGTINSVIAYHNGETEYFMKFYYAKL